MISQSIDVLNHKPQSTLIAVNHLEFRLCRPSLNIVSQYILLVA